MYKIVIRVIFLSFLCLNFSLAKDTKTVIISAEGLADPNADIYSKDKSIMIDDLRNDAKKQLIEKAVGSYVDSHTLVENYVTIEDKVLSRSSGLIKRVIKESPSWIGDDGFAHILMEAEVYMGEVKDALQDLSKTQKISIIKTQGNPRISVDISVRGNPSTIAENKLKEYIKKFGYTVWSEKGTKSHQKPDFTINGEAKFKTLRHRLKASGITVEKTILTSWTVSCIDRNSLEEIYFNNKVPKKRSWNSEEEAIEEIGKLIGNEFSADFFVEKLNNPIKSFLMEVDGLPDIDVAQLFKKEFIGLRSVLRVNFRTFNTEGVSVYEVDFGGAGSNFAMVLKEGVINPINKKIGKDALKLVSFSGNVLKLKFSKNSSGKKVAKTLQEMPPASLNNTPKERLASLAKSEEAKEKLALIAGDKEDGVMTSIANF